MAASLLAHEAVTWSLESKPWVKILLAPGPKVVTDYLGETGSWGALNAPDFNPVGYGCATCIDNPGPLFVRVSAVVNGNDLAAVPVLSGSHNLEGRINPDVKMNYPAFPPLVIAYILTSTMGFDSDSGPLEIDPAARE